MTTHPRETAGSHRGLVRVTAVDNPEKLARQQMHQTGTITDDEEVFSSHQICRIEAPVTS